MAGFTGRSPLATPRRLNPIEAFFAELDPRTPGSSLFPQTPSPPPPPLTVPQFRRGPMYSAYTHLREMKLRRRMKEEEERRMITPVKKLAPLPSVARSVPDFSALLRKEKENKKPRASISRFNAAASVSPLQPKGSSRRPDAAVTPKSGLRMDGSVSAGRWEEKRGGGVKVRKSYSCLKELKGVF